MKVFFEQQNTFSRASELLEKHNSFGVKSTPNPNPKSKSEPSKGVTKNVLNLDTTVEEY